MVMLLFAGKTGPKVKLADCMREMHAEESERRTKEIAKRAKEGVPMDEHAKWTAIVEAHNRLTEAVAAEDAVMAKVAAAAVIEQTARALTPLDALVLPEGAEEITLTIRALSASERSALNGDESGAWSEIEAATKANDGRALAAAYDSLGKARAAFVKAAVVAIDGIEDETGEARPEMNDTLLDALRTAKLLGPIYGVVAHYQELPAKKALRFGVPPASTSPLTTAGSAPSFDASNAVAMAALLAAMGPVQSLPVPNGRQTHAHDDTSSIIPT